MIRTLAIVLVVTACNHDQQQPALPDAAVDAAPDAPRHPDDGFGNPCTPMGGTNGHLYTECKSEDGLTGICSLNDSDGTYACRRFCTTSSGGCPTGQVPKAGVENTCWCEPPP